MNKKLLFAIAFMFFSLNLLAQNEKAAHRVVIHLSSNDTLVWKGLMNNIKNLKNTWNDSVAIEVVANGPGIELLMLGKTTQQEKIGYYKSKGVAIFACENTMAERKISKESIIPESGFVRSAIVHLVLQQEKGWSYIKVGF